MSKAAQETKIAIAVCSSCFLNPKLRKCNLCKYNGEWNMSVYNGWTPSISEEEKLKNILASCDEILESEPDNQWWQNYRQQTQERLEKIYQAEHDDVDWADEMADYRSGISCGVGL